MATKKVIPIQPLTAWSFSRYTAYKECPAKLKYSAIDKISEPSNTAMQRGNAIHQMAENYIKGTLKVLPPELKLFKDELAKLKKMFKADPGSMIVEQQWAFSKAWGDSSWFDMATCWARIKMDCGHHEDDTTLIVTDWKTGKFREHEVIIYTEQLELYALSAMLLHPHIETVRPRLVYLDQDLVWDGPPNKPLVFTRTDIPALKKAWEKRVKPMLADTIFAPRPNSKCKWCFYGQSGKVKGGPGLCKY